MDGKQLIGYYYFIGNYGTIGRTSTGMASMMDEMAKTLARRRAQAEKKPEVCIGINVFFLLNTKI